MSGVYGQGRDDPFHYDKPKTEASIRTVRMPSFVADLLAQEAPQRQPDDLVFTAPGRRPIRWDNFRNRAWRRAVEEALPPEKHGLRFHDLRHTHASMLTNAGYNPKAIQAQLGHSSITMTFDRYGHLAPGWNDDLPDLLDQLHRATRLEVVA